LAFSTEILALLIEHDCERRAVFTNAMKRATNNVSQTCGREEGMTRRRALGTSAGIAVLTKLPMSGLTQPKTLRNQKPAKPREINYIMPNFHKLYAAQEDAVVFIDHQLADSLDLGLQAKQARGVDKLLWPVESHTQAKE
jgi:hypothetical protein